MAGKFIIIVAATENMGIGYNGGLPWCLRNEMAYFSRITKAVGKLPDGERKALFNAVIMGRKCWESIPRKFRPLQDRINIVISSKQDLQLPRDVYRAGSLDDAILLLQKHHSQGSMRPVNRAFVIGGSRVYLDAMQDHRTSHILMTIVHRPFICDTFFPVDILHDPKWTKKSHMELEQFVDSQVPQGVVQERGTEYEYTLWQRK